MEDFYKEFKDRVEGRPDPEFRPEDWADMEARLDNDASGVAPFPWLWWTLPVAILGLIGWNVYLQNQLSTDNNESPIAQTFADTVIIEKIIYRTDTVYQEKIEYVTLPPEVIERIVYVRAHLAAQEGEGFVFTDEGNKVGFSDQNMSRLGAGEDQGSVGLTNANISAGYSDKMTGLSKSMISGSSLILNPVPSLALRSLESNGSQGTITRFRNTPYLDLAKLSKKRHQRPDAFRPRALSIEVGSGLSNAFETDIEHLFGYSLFAGAKLRFDPGYRLWADVSLQNLLFKANEMGEDNGVPVVIPPSDQFDFENAQVPRRAVQYAMGLDYVFYSKKMLRPVLGIGIAGVEYFHTEIIYDFVNRDTGAEFIFEKNSDDASLRVNYALFKFGMEYSLSRRYNLGFTGFYRKGLDDAFGVNNVIEGRLSISARIF